MRIRFQADADLNEDIRTGVTRREPLIDFRSAEDANLEGLHDSEVLAIASHENRVLVTHDRRTMPRHFADFISSNSSPGVFIISQNSSLGIAVEELVLIWTASESEDWRNLIINLPL